MSVISTVALDQVRIIDIFDVNLCLLLMVNQWVSTFPCILLNLVLIVLFAASW